MMQISKPIIRWIIGPCHAAGFESLTQSIKRFKRIYGGCFYYIICFNQLDEFHQSKLPVNSVDAIINQNDYRNELDKPPPQIGNLIAGPCWKLYPPRLSANQHEIIIDNDVIIYKRFPEIEKFLETDDLFLISQAFQRSYHGRFEKLVKDNFNINSGLVCLPPKFDYAAKINNLIRETKGTWQTHFEEQSLVATVLQDENVEIIPINKIQVSGPTPGFKIGSCGTHFCGVNKGYVKDWDIFKKTFLFL
jgi:hypothetical protein